MSQYARMKASRTSRTKVLTVSPSKNVQVSIRPGYCVISRRWGRYAACNQGEIAPFVCAGIEDEQVVKRHGDAILCRPKTTSCQVMIRPTVLTYTNNDLSEN